MEYYPLRRDLAYGYPLPGSPAEFDVSSTCNHLDILKYTDASNNTYFRHEEGTLDDTALNDWSRRQHQNADSGDHVFSGGLRLMFEVCGFNPVSRCHTVPFTKSAFTELEESFGLPEQFLEVLTGSGARAFKTSCPLKPTKTGFNPSTCFVFRFGIFKPNYYQLALSYDPNSQLTYGLLLAKAKDHQFPKLIQALKRKERYCTQPLLVASLLIDLVITSNAERIQAADWRLNELEEMMGQHEYLNRPRGDPLEMDFIATARTLNTTSRMMGVEIMRLSANILALEMIMKETMELQTKEGDAQQQDDDANRLIRELSAYQLNACRNLVLRAQYEEKRVQSQIAVVYQFMAQKDSKVNISLAETSTTIAQESKKDSSSMKSIAVLTMCFLPGTFLATIFAMPAFNWDGDGLPVIRNGFRYYWAIAIPLTVLVLLVWILAMVLPWSDWWRSLRRKSRPGDLEPATVKETKGQ